MHCAFNMNFSNNHPLAKRVHDNTDWFKTIHNENVLKCWMHRI